MRGTNIDKGDGLDEKIRRGHESKVRMKLF